MRAISSCRFFRALLGLCFFVLISRLVFAQEDEARDAIDKGEYVRAINILSDKLATSPTADTYLYLGVAYSRMKEYQKAEDTLKEGSRRYPNDSRFHNELADLYLTNNDRDAAKSELRRALVVDPGNNYASDLLATIDMSEGEVQAALRSWNNSGRPVINDILHNYYLRFGSWVVRDAVAFHPAGVLRYSEWKTTESRLLETDNFANVGLEIEPTRVPDQYNAVVRTNAKTNSFSNFLFGILKGAPIETSYFDLWNIVNSGITFNSNYRWDTSRRRLEGRLKIPVPFAGLLHLEVGNTWRAERWDLTPTIRPELKGLARLDYKANAPRVHIKYIPHYRLELGGGFEYRNRASKGNLPQLFTDNRKTGKFDAELSLRLIDRQYQNRLHLEGFGARRSVLGDTNFSGGVAELDNRITLSRDTRTNLDWTIKTGTSRGALPVEDYFVLGLDTYPAPTNILRGHTAAEHGHYGRAPMGTDFALVNTDIERRLATIPFFNTFNIPFLTVKWNLFFDGAKTWDRNRIFQQGKLLLDTGGGLRLETPTHSFNLLYGRSLREGKNVLYAYVERRLW
jgi:tetratricopeptide (TPR) repeat protein